MKRFVISFGWLMAVTFVAVAATATSNEFRLDFYGLGPWERRVARSTETIAYSTAWATNAPAGAKAVVKVYPCLKEKPTYIAIDLSGGTNATHYPISFFNEIPGGSWSDEYKTSKLVLRHIPAGSFIMGGRNTDYPGAVNTNLHMVTITRDFYMGVFEVTQRQWELVMGNRPSAFSNETCYATRPVEMVSYADVRGGNNGLKWPQSSLVDDSSFMGKLRGKTGMNEFDLPTEAQWEYACRAGTTTALNNGRNIAEGALIGIGEPDPAIDEVGRYGVNSGYSSRGENGREYFTARTSVIGSATVGTYLSNQFGLFDMHGNVWEMGLDYTAAIASGSVDPKGPEGSEFSRRIYRGGSWVDWTTYGSALRSSSRPSPGELGETNVFWNVGFRICLHDAVGTPSSDSATVLVNASGGAVVDWTPTQSGTYYLTHEVQTNGVAASAIYGAAFQVAGPEVKIVANGELVPGVTVTIEGAGDWPVYYTTDGSAPTQASSRYEGPFTFDAAAQVRAVAISDGGVRSEVASADFTLHDALSVVGAVARPRYPWNGLVDVDCTVTGDPSLEYLVSLEALDLLGGTNLPMRTVAVGRAAPSVPQTMAADGVLNGGCGGQGLPALPPGRYRFTWDTAADIEGDFDFNRVAVTVKATGSHLLAYPKTLELTIAGYTGTEVLTNVPTLVRLSTNITGFAYSDFATTNGTDLAFFTPEGQSLPYEIDEWNVGGESLVWVKLPTLANGTSFICAYGAQSNNRTIEQSNNPHAVWRDYAGVWHMNEDSGTAFDSTAHHLDGIPSCGTNELADVNQMVAYENGACGRARVNGMAELEAGNFMMVPSYDALGLKDCFVVSGWFNIRSAESYPKLIVRSDLWTDGWGIEVDKNNLGKINVVGGVRESHLSAFLSSDLTTGWTSLAFCYEEDAVSVYENGVCLTNNVVIGAATENGRPLAFGNRPNGLNRSLCGQYDEIRLRGGSLSADRIRADYDMIANREFLSYGVVRSGCDEAAK